MPYISVTRTTGTLVSRPQVLEFVTTGVYPSYNVFTFLCFCGRVFSTTLRNVRSGHTKSCGCLKNGLLVQRSLRHGQSTRKQWSRAYASWVAMIQRCENLRSTSYRFYGAKRVLVIPRWHDFQEFFADMGERPVGKTLDRINPFGNYEPGNCRWATVKEQANNQS